MDLGDGSYFVEETSLACAPPVSFEILKSRLISRLSSKGIQIEEITHEEHCLFPMNLPLPYRDQPLLAFGGSASMVHPASGYLVGSLLRRAPSLAKEIAKKVNEDFNEKQLPLMLGMINAIVEDKKLELNWEAFR